MLSVDLQTSFLEGEEYTIQQEMSERRLSVVERKDKALYKTLSKLITAIGNFSIQYNFQSISISLLIMSSSVCTSSTDSCKDGDQAGWVVSTASAVVFAGAIVGQLTMGYAGDILGRNTAMLMTLSLVCVGALSSSLLSWGSPSTIYLIVILSRFVLGIGAGGVYPLSATKAAEDDGHGHGGAVNIYAASWAFFWQVPGTMVPWLLALILSRCDGLSASFKWRFLLGLGALPAAVVVVLTYWGMQIQKNLSPADSSKEKKNIHFTEDGHASKSILKYLQDWDIIKKLIATGGSWFLYDVAYYGVNLFGGDIVSAINSSDDDNVSNDSSISNVTEQQLIGLTTSIPACLFAIYCLYHFNTKQLQTFGFIFIGFWFTILAIFFVPLRDSNSNALFSLYCMLLFSLSYGPNLSTFVLPAETYPHEIRATFNGISAACGKLGAVVGVFLFGAMSDATTYPAIMIVCAFCCLLGAIISIVFIQNQKLLDFSKMGSIHNIPDKPIETPEGLKNPLLSADSQF